MSNSRLLYIFIVFVLDRCHSSKQHLLGLNFFNLHCRDNYDVPVDWWYIYKPPQDTGPYYESGSNFTYITSSTLERWRPSRTLINSNSMLQRTLAPLYRKSYKQYLAILSYGAPGSDEMLEEEINTMASTAYGTMFANSMGGVWVGHTVPNFPDLLGDRAKIPVEEFKSGHLLMCLTLDLRSLNQFAAVVRHTDPTILKLAIPNNLKSSLPNWVLFQTDPARDDVDESETRLWEFLTRDKTLQGIMLARSPRDPRCLYKTFAEIRSTVIDVYSSAYNKEPPVCEENYSLRYIDSISLKFPEQKVYYVNNKTDKASFAVSTAAVWQRLGQNKDQYWTCVGNVERQYSHMDKGGLIACAEQYLIWLTFDNLKVKEPEC